MSVEKIVKIMSKLESEQELIRSLSKLEKFKEKGWAYEFLGDYSDFYVISPNEKVYSRGYFFNPSKEGMPLQKEEIQAIHFINKIDLHHKKKTKYYCKYFLDYSIIEFTDQAGFYPASKN